MNAFEDKQVQNRLAGQGLIPVASLPSVDAGLRLGEILARHGMQVVEITLRTSHAAKGIAELRRRFPQLLVLAGTVLSTEQVDRALDAGAQAIVSPGTDAAVVRHCRNLHVPVFPGVCTPTEVQQARSLGVTQLKFFPAELSGGVPMVRMLLGVYRDISLMPTGGITQANLREYLAIDRVLCCGGTWLAPESMMAENAWEEIEDRIRTVAESLATLIRI